MSSPRGSNPVEPLGLSDDLEALFQSADALEATEDAGERAALEETARRLVREHVARLGAARAASMAEASP